MFIIPVPFLNKDSPLKNKLTQIALPVSDFHEDQQTTVNKLLLDIWIRLTKHNRVIITLQKPDSFDFFHLWCQNKLILFFFQPPFVWTKKS